MIGRLTEDKVLHLRYNGSTVGKLDMKFLHDGLPQVTRIARWTEPPALTPEIDDPADLTPHLHGILSSWNVCSKEWIVRQYDHEVQGGSVLKPLQGVDNDGPGDASITRPRLDSYRGVILSNGLNPKYGQIDPYWMAASAIDEAIRNIVAVGGDLSRTALLDNFCWGNPDKPDRLGGLVRAAQACYDIAIEYGTPFISGKDSLNNEYTTEKGESIAIPPTLLISAISIMPDCRKAVSMDFKVAGNLIYLVGDTKDEMGGSHYYLVREVRGTNVPNVDAPSAKRIFEAMASATAEGLVSACHDCSEGGLGVAAAEMAFAGGLGANIRLQKVVASKEITRNDTRLFSESNSRFVVEVAPGDRIPFEHCFEGLPIAVIGEVRSDDKFTVLGNSGETVVDTTIDALKESWQKPLRW